MTRIPNTAMVLLGSCSVPKQESIVFFSFAVLVFCAQMGRKHRAAWGPKERQQKDHVERPRSLRPLKTQKASGNGKHMSDKHDEPQDYPSEIIRGIQKVLWVLNAIRRIFSHCGLPSQFWC